MKDPYITLGNWNKHYLYFIATVICMNIWCITSGFGYHTYQIGIFIDDEHIGHLYIHKLFYYVLILICSFFYWLYERKRDSNNNELIQENNDENNFDNNNTSTNSNLIYHDIYYYGNKIISDSFAFIIIFLFVFVEIIDRIVHQFFAFGDYWMFELIIMAYLHNKMFNLKIYKHQKLSIYLIILPVILKSITIVFLFCDENNYFTNDEINYKYNDKITQLKSLFVAHAWLFPIGMILYIIVMLSNCYLIINIKKIIDLKYVSISKLLIFYGLFGAILSSIISLVATFVSFGLKKETIYDIYDYICYVVDKNGNRYIENFKIYFTGTIWKDILYTLIGAIGYNTYILFIFEIIKHLNPIYKSFFTPVSYFIQKLILMYQINSNEQIKYLNASYFIDFASDITSIIGFLIYLEIIELNFCGFNENLKKNIILRGKFDGEHNRESNVTDTETDFTKDNNTLLLNEND